MNILKNKKLVLIFSTLLLIGGISLLVFKDTKNPGTLNIRINNGDNKYVTVNSNKDGSMGVFYASNITISLSRNKHIMEVTTDNIQTEVVSIDFTKGGNKNIELTLKSKDESESVVKNDYSGVNALDIKNCRSFTNNTWIICDTSDGSTSESNVYKKSDSKWIYVVSGSRLTVEDVKDTGAPQDLIDYLGE